MAHTIPAEHLTTVDFGAFWAAYFPTGLGSITRETLQSAKEALLGAGVPARTALYYFIELGSMVDADQLGMVEEVQDALQDMA